MALASVWKDNSSHGTRTAGKQIHLWQWTSLFSFVFPCFAGDRLSRHCAGIKTPLTLPCSDAHLLLLAGWICQYTSEWGVIIALRKKAQAELSKTCGGVMNNTRLIEN
uniref:Uncharacterized protein n=1 Tax=Mus musculus TaxID=10090 RepID=Q3TYT3_MOUSE|nr:unnamed protein product [Mus musculus]